MMKDRKIKEKRKKKTGGRIGRGVGGGIQIKEMRKQTKDSKEVGMKANEMELETKGRQKQNKWRKRRIRKKTQKGASAVGYCIWE